ncbi:MAG: ferrous iron transport protein B [Euryarchaeota archaeon]|nr:ferrous iron transport protein B [Euryarchaeota archaeon]
MHCHESKSIARARRRIALVGNPNVGKSVIFGFLTGKYVTVSNYPGTTVEIAQGTANFSPETLVIDTPGVNDLIPMSEDERVTRDILLNEGVDLVVQVVDSKNLRRGLSLTLQLAEMGLPLVLVLNMEDEARSRGISINVAELSRILGVPVVSTIATQKKGLSELVKSLEHASKPAVSFSYPPEIEEAVRRVEALLPEARLSRRALAVMLLAGDESLSPWLLARLPEEKVARIEGIRRSLERRFGSVHYAVSRARLRVVDEVVERVLERRPPSSGENLARLGELTMHPIYGIPFLLLVLFGMYEFVGVFGAGEMVDFFEGVLFGEYLNPAAERLVREALPVPLLQELLVGEFGIITMALTYSVAIILPIVGTFFIAFGVLEDSGYLPRLAVMTNRIFKVIGLNGKAVLPMVLGLGCDTMATLTTRILETRKERIIATLLLALAVPCSAQLGVILGMLASLSAKAVLLWAGVVVMVMLLVGFLAARLVKGEPTDFIMEIPPLRVPQLGNIAAKTLARIEWYLREAVPLFILGTLLLFTLDKLGALGGIRDLASPVVVGLLGLPREATDAFIVGFLRRDYGAAGLFALAEQGMLSPVQTVVALVTMTLFVPCIANFLIIVKERGLRVALAIVSFIFPFAFTVGAVVNFLLRKLGVSL